MEKDDYQKTLEFLCLVEESIKTLRENGYSTKTIFKSLVKDYRDKNYIQSFNALCDLYDNYRINGIISDKLATEMVVANYIINRYKKWWCLIKQDDLVNILNKHNLSENEINNIINHLKHPYKKYKEYTYYTTKSNLKIGVISDTHIGSSYFNKSVLEHSIKTFDKENVELILHSGDIIEGMSNREGHIYDLKHLGTSAQIDYAVELLKKYKQPLYFITGNHDEWAKKKSNQGVLVGELLEQKLENATFLGEYSADIKLKNITIRLTHEGNNAYALSYSLQKRINSITGGNKPDILINGHLHKAIYLFYRNIHAIEAGTLQEQTPFMRDKGSPAMLGYWVIEIGISKKGLNDFTPKFYPFY